jgi:hypothetical protein
VRTVLAAAFIAAFVAFTWVSLSPALAVISLVVLLVATHTYFLPIEYTFTDRGVAMDKLIFSYDYEWARFRRYFRTTGGIVLSPFSRRTWLDNFRGVHLLLPKDDSTIVGYLDRRFAPPPTDDRLKLDD